jgi:uncharacterized protein (DUF305 family)
MNHMYRDIGVTLKAAVCTIALAIVGISLPASATKGVAQNAIPAMHRNQAMADKSAGDSAWSELTSGMQKMHAAMMSIEPSGNNDVDFVRLMIPHHQAAIDMARTQLLHGKDPQLRRLAQQIITDQQSEIELMKLWLERHDYSSPNSGGHKHGKRGEN